MKNPDDVTGTEAFLKLIPTTSASANAISLDIETVGGLDPTIYSEAFRNLYNYLDSDVSSRAASTYIQRGRQEFEDHQYQSAIADLLKATEIAPLDDEAWFYLAESYKESGDTVHATQAYSKIVNEMADSIYADKARSNLSNGAAADDTDQDQANDNDNGGEEEENNNTAEVTNEDLIAQALAMQALQAGAGETDNGAE